MTRRQLLRRGAVGGAALSLPGLLAACGQSPSQIVSSERFVLIEHMLVVGSCAEEGARAYAEEQRRRAAEVEKEAAQIDGSSRIGAFVRVVLPLSVPGIATASILSFIFSWNNFLFALVLSNQETRTLPVAIVNFTSYASVDWGGLMAAAVVITVPVMIIALIAQRYVVSGLTAGATKG